MSAVQRLPICRNDKITYCTSDIVKDTCEQIGLILENVYHVDSMYTFYYPGYNIRSTDLNAYIGLLQMKILDDYCKKRYEISKKSSDLKKIDGSK